MNKLTAALVLGTGLSLGVAAPSAQADPLVQTLATPDLSATTFNNDFTPVTAAMTSSFTFLGSNDPGGSGVMESQVFQSKTDPSLYAYAYQLGVNNTTDSSGNPVNVQSASWKFNATPVATNLVNSDPNQQYYAYAVKDGQVGGISLPQAAPGQQILSPASLAWEPNKTVGSLVASYVDPTGQTPALGAGGNSATFVVLTNQPYTQQFVNVQSPDPIAPNSSLTAAYAATGGSIAPIPAPEPATVLGWAGVVGGLALLRRARRARPATA